MEKPKITDYDFTYGCIDGQLECDQCESEWLRYKIDLELWEVHQAEQAEQAERAKRAKQVEQVEQDEQAKRADNFWMVAGGPSAPRVQHISYESAHNEAKRLAEKQPGMTLYVVRPITKIIAEPPKAVSTALTLWSTT
jgi:hypothetical protein